jgi:hypothetical protein
MSTEIMYLMGANGESMFSRPVSHENPGKDRATTIRITSDRQLMENHMSKNAQ